MTIEMPTYIETISELWPTYKCSALGDGTDYNSIDWGNDTPISQVDLDKARLDLLKTKMWTLIQAERDRRKSGGVKIGENWYHSNDTSRIQHLGLIMFGSNMPTGIMWKTMNGTFVEMTPQLAQQLFSTVAALDIAIFAQAEIHKASMYASPDPISYNYLTGWPLIYGE